MLGSLLAGLAPIALGAGTLLQMNALRNQQRMQNEANARYAAQLRGYSDEANDIFRNSLAQSNIDRTQETVDNARDVRVQDYRDFAAADGFDPTMPGLENMPTIVGQDAARTLGERLSEAEKRIRAQAYLYGFGDRNLDRGIELQRANELQTNLGLYGRGARMVRDTGLNAAQNAGGSLLGDLLVGGGMLGMSYGG